MRMSLAGGRGHTLLAECPGALLQYFDTRQACALRLVCREFQAAVAAYPWEDRETVIQGSIGAWHVCFPRARCASVNKWRRRAPVVDADFLHFVGLWELNMVRCTAVTDAAFVHLRGICVLDMSWCVTSPPSQTLAWRTWWASRRCAYRAAARPPTRTLRMPPCGAFACST